MKLAILCPAYNEEKIIPSSVRLIEKKFFDLVGKKKIDADSFLVVVSDGSRDGTFEALVRAKQEVKMPIKILKLSYNVGQQKAMLAGFHFLANKVDACIQIDIDLEHDIEKMDEFIDKYNAGAEVIFGVKNKQIRFFSLLYYKLESLLGMGGSVATASASYLMLSNKVLSPLNEYREKNFSLRNILSVMNFRMDKVYYDVKDVKGRIPVTHFTSRVEFALDSITSFSVRPLRFIFFSGIFFFFFAIFLTFYGLFSLFFSEKYVQGWLSIVVPLYFFGGVNLLALGIIGEYLGKVMSEVKERPLYYIERVEE